jgi:hypothetical protein
MSAGPCQYIGKALEKQAVLFSLRDQDFTFVGLSGHIFVFLVPWLVGWLVR